MFLRVACSFLLTATERGWVHYTKDLGNDEQRRGTRRGHSVRSVPACRMSLSVGLQAASNFDVSHLHDALSVGPLVKPQKDPFFYSIF